MSASTASTGIVTGLNIFLSTILLSLARQLFMYLVSIQKKKLCRCSFMMVTSQRLNINLTDKVFRRVEPFREELRSHRIWGQLQLFLNPCLTPYREPEGLTGKDRGLRRSFRQMKMMHGFLLSLSVCLLSLSQMHTHTDTHTPSSFSLYFIYSMQPCSPISHSLAAVQLLCRRLSSLWLRQEQAD